MRGLISHVDGRTAIARQILAANLQFAPGDGCKRLDFGDQRAGRLFGL
jgi:hypothetical protein